MGADKSSNSGPCGGCGRRGVALAAVALAVSLAAGACVRSKVVITSSPPGADVTMNDVHLGRTPVEAPFTWYWYYDFVAVQEGHGAAYQRRRFKAPWYLVPPLDLAMEMVPVPVRDTRHVHLILEEDPAGLGPVFVLGGSDTPAAP